ncbi:MAG: DUF1517 domain-containing protein [Meiothermus sp.]|uniref:DUF1517 domain-containing protein n=1 Tax=Meiothermus sp. TaxID=1955249 RepID=UPI0025FC91F8|nr:DUF1517 domain-containing protein [Meiothermus sp.]MCS7194822.1 DUF1517 domain-containing protein [Meiothermus sp.]
MLEGMQGAARMLFTILLILAGLTWGLSMWGWAWGQRSGGGVGGRGGFSAPRSLPSVPRVNPAPTPSWPLPTPTYPSPRPPIYVAPGTGPSRGFDLVALLLIGGIVLLTLYMVRGLKRAGTGDEEATVARLRLAILYSPTLQQRLRRLAEEADTESVRGLADLVDNAAVLLLREAPGWRFGQYEVWQGPLEEAEGRFDAWMSETRAEFVETFQHFEGRKEVHNDYRPQAEPDGRYILATLLLAVRGGLPPVPTPLRREGAKAALLALTTSSPTNTLASYLAWTPEAPGEALTEGELLKGWPQLELL